MTWLFFACLAFCSMLCAPPLSAAELLLTDAARGQDAGRHLAFWRDADGHADLAAAQAADRLGRFVPTDGVTSFGIDPAPHWFRLDVRRPAGAPDTWWLELPHPGLDDVRVYVPNDSGGFDVTQVGDHQPFADRPLRNRNFVFPLRLPAERTATLYVRIQTADTLIFPFHLWRPDRFAAADEAEIALIGLYYGLILAMLIYNLLLYAKLRDPLYASYLTFSLVILLVVAQLNGQAFQYLWPNNLWLADRQHVIIPAAAVFATLAFMRRLFELRTTAPRLDMAVRVLTWLTLAALAIGIGPDYGFGHRMLLMILPVLSVVGLAAGIHSLRQGYRPAVYFLVAQACFQGSVILVAGNSLGLWSMHILIQQAIGIGSALEALLFSQALAERIALLRVEKEAATRRAIAAEIANESKSKILAAVSHDLRQPIQALTLFLDVLAKRTTDGDARAIVAKMDTAVLALSELIETFLDVSHLDSGVIEPKIRPVAISALFERVIGEFEVQADSAGLRMKVWLPRADVVVATDPGLLLTLLRNLVANAIRYTARGGLMLACRKRGTHVLIQVWDTGRGIPVEERERIFDEFYRSGHAPRGDGKGLGLYIVDRIAKLLGYRIGLRSKVGTGTVFELTLPAVAD